MSPTTDPLASESTRQLLDTTHEIAADFLSGLRDRRVGSLADYATLLEVLGGPLPVEPQDPVVIIRELAAGTDAGLVATAGPRFFGLVIGGALPVALAADWLTSAWDQHAFSFALSPAATVVEEVCRRWLADLLGLAPDVSLGLVTGATMANLTGLAAARHALLERCGWDVEAHGLFGAPPITVVTSDESHATIFAALQMLGMGHSRVTRVSTDEQGRMRTGELRSAVERIEGPLVVCAQAGNVNTGAFDPIAEAADIVHAVGGWLHVDGAFGVWAAASDRLRHLIDGLALADSVAVDAHKWLNVPYDCGFAFTRHPSAHRAAMTVEAPYYAPSPQGARTNHHFVPESSRRARGFAIYAALRSLGRRGVSDLVERCCGLARRMAERLSRHPRVQVLNEVVLNQVLVRFAPPAVGGADRSAFTAEVIRRVQDDGTCWLGGGSWHGVDVMRISISNWSTTEEDIDRSCDAILRCVDEEERLRENSC